MRKLELFAIAFAAALLTGCSFGGTENETLSTAPTAVAAPPAETPAATATTAAPAPAAPAPASSREVVETFEAHIDASAFLNALVDSGCQIDKAEYKEVKRGGAIRVSCTKSVDALDVELDDL